METVAFAGYAYYSTGGEGFIYSLSSKDAESTGTPVILVNATSKAVNLFPFLFLVVGGVLMVGLMAFVMVTFCCRRKVAKLEKMYWELQYAFADVNNTLVQEASRRTPSAVSTSPVSLKQRHTPQSTSRLVAGSQSPPQMMQRHGSIARAASMRPSQHVLEPLPPPAAPVFPATPLPYVMNANPLYFQPVTASAASPYTCSYGDKGAQVTVFAAQPPPIPSPQPHQQTRISSGPAVPQSPRTTPEPPLRRRASKVSFIGA
ncbi:conserved hypothetical protein [Leishmania mexicana MHOM/GT/2001/U1103]|uniref:Uncharacterized protein n=1 Tax=Leishmania mexicana (strain MHOM/GT/2001/U1103) TaxID=929439 RepID=E9AK05_LEIMU|nr:conserved hypothetical protein [Leishmania mexicana MHOM/GT/2001/U1103]CBZ23255.1 conserved hypothetical protein [Leishmania mexicana MHOM/GT/2001/U1103]